MKARVAAGRAIALFVFGLASDQSNIGQRIAIEAHLQRYGDGFAMSNRVERIAAIKALGVSGVRLDFEWSAIEKVEGTWDWTRLDSIVQELQGEALGAYGLLTFSPTWAVPKGMPERHRPVVGGSIARGDSAFAHFAAMTVRRYHRMIRRWEVWNEENNPTFWINVTSGRNAGPDAADYLRLFVLARDSIHAADPTAEISIGGLAALSGRFQSMEDPSHLGPPVVAAPGHVYLRQLLLEGWTPGIVSVHPYSGLPPGRHRPGESTAVFPDQVFDSVEAVLAATGHDDTPIWITEWGVSAHAGMTLVDADGWFHDALQDLLCDSHVRFVTIYALTDSGSGTSYGLFHSDGRRTLLGQALADALSKGPGCGA